MDEKKTFEASLDTLHEMVAFVKSHAANLGFDGVALSRVELVTEEALVNIISHGYHAEQKEQPNGKTEADKKKIETIAIQLSNPTAESLKIVIKDQGAPFDPVENAKDVDVLAPLEKRTYGGYGIYFMMKVMDEVDYKRENDTNVLTMVKYLSNSA